MAVLHLVRTSNQDTVDALRYLLDRALVGKIVGFTGAIRDDHGMEEGLSTGVYKAHPELAVMTTLRISLKLLKSDDDDAN